MFSPSLYRLTCVLMVSLVSAATSRIAEAGPAGLQPEQRSIDEIRGAERDLEIATIKLRLYVHVEYARERRRLDDEIRLARAEKEALDRHVVEYSNFTRFEYSQPMMLTLDESRLSALRAKLYLEQLIEEKFRLQQHFVDSRRLLELEIEGAADRLGRLRPASAEPSEIARPPLAGRITGSLAR